MALGFLRMGLVAGAFIASTTALAGADGGMIGRTCNGCHGTDGVSKGFAASLKGRPADYLEQTMKDYKAGKRPGTTIMDRIAKGYTDEELAAVALYFSTLE